MAKVLLVGPRAGFWEEARNTLESRGHDAILEPDGAEALAQMFKTQPDIVVCDHHVTNLSGLELCRLVKTHPAGQRVAFVLVTRLPTNPDLYRELSRHSHLDDILPHPHSSIEIVERVEAWLFRANGKNNESNGTTKPTPIKHAANGKAIPTQGRLDEYSFATLLREIYRTRFNGSVNLTEGRKKMRILFKNGNPIGLRSNYTREHALGQRLVKDRRLTTVQLDRALEYAHTHHLRLGQALAKLGLIKKADLQNHLRQQYNEKLLSLFQPNWKGGEFALHPGEFPPDPDFSFETSTITLIQEGIRRTHDLKSLTYLFAEKNRSSRVCRMTAEADDLLPQLELDDQQRRVLELLRGGMTLAEIAAVTKLERVQLMSFLYTLLVLRAVRFDDPPAEPNSRATATIGAPERENATLVDLAAAAMSSGHTAPSATATIPPRVTYATAPQRRPETSTDNENITAVQMGRHFFETGDFEKAVHYLEQASHLRPNSPRVLSMLAWSVFMTRSPQDQFAVERAKELCKQAIRLEPAHARAYLVLTKIARYEKNDRVADSYAMKAFELDPVDPDIKHQYELARIRRRNQTH